MGPIKPGGTKKTSSSIGRSQKPSSNQPKQRSRPEQQKSKRATPLTKTKQKKKTYTAEELGVPKLNGIMPTGVQKAKGKKKGKVFIDDPKSMMTILAMVNADKEGQIESKMVKARQMEEIREARRKEVERKQQSKQATVEALKESIKRKRKPKLNSSDAVPTTGGTSRTVTKSVSFA